MSVCVLLCVRERDVWGLGVLVKRLGVRGVGFEIWGLGLRVKG